VGLHEQLGITTTPANAAQRAMQRLASSRPGSWVFQRTLYPFDKLLFTFSGGRVTAPGLVAGLPVIMLTTTGAKSGQERTMPLVGVPVDGELVVIGSNYGQERTPGWVYNLEANPAATVAYRSASVPVRARLATPAETEAAFAEAAKVYPGYAKYRERASHRTIRAFVLEAAD
jgi:deazaflavin-dependent oxidoreductase (nitroreductase family)